MIFRWWRERAKARAEYIEREQLRQQMEAVGLTLGPLETKESARRRARRALWGSDDLVAAFPGLH